METTTNNAEGIVITLADGATRQTVSGTTGHQFAKEISISLAKKALAVSVDGEVQDLNYPLMQDAKVTIITKDSPEALELLRHDCAHVLAEAVQTLYPNAQVTIGPAIEQGFYYDFATETPFTPEDLTKIEKQMQKVVKAGRKFEREIWDRTAAIEHFTGRGEQYKVELIEDLPADEPISIYKQGDWLDLCRGPHQPSTKHVGTAFKLLKTAGAYWRGDSQRPMLTRIYGTAFFTQEDLDLYLEQQAEAEKRNHIKLGKEMDLFHFQPEAPGAVFWHPDGWTIYRTLVAYLRGKLETAGYQEISTPEVIDRSLWEKSGHWDKFQENMFTTELDEKTYAVKPMNCPGCVQVYNYGMKSYRELPLRMSEFGKCHRYEASGALNGLMRVRAFVQDDAHIFCTEDQIQAESKDFCELILAVYKDFGFESVQIKLSDRPEQRVGSDEVWDKAEQSLHDVLAECKLDYTVNPGEGAFYGPKLEFVLRDAIGRDWQCGTLQVDLSMPVRLDARFVDEDGSKKHPVMLHRALLGSIERFIGILLENYAGRLPFWLAPQQVVVCTVNTNDDVLAYAKKVMNQLVDCGVRANVDLRNEKISYKIREHSHGLKPAIIIIGDQEAQGELVSVRELGSKETKQYELESGISYFKQLAAAPGE